MKKLIVLLLILIAACFTTQAQSVRISPDSAASFWQANVLFKWHTLSLTTDSLYHIQVATSAAFSTLLVNDSTKVGDTDTTKLWTGFYNTGTTYYWRVRTKTKGVTHPATWSSYSTSWPLTLDTVAVTRISPDSGSVFWTRSFTLKWHKLSTKDSLYWVHVSTNSAFSNTAFVDSTLTDTTKTITGFYPDTAYYWRVRVKVKGVTSASGTWSSYNTTGWSLAVYGLVVQTTPLDYSQLSPPVYFRWDTLAAQDTLHHLQIATSSAFSTLIVNDSTITTPYKNITWLPSGANLFWRVRIKMKGDTLPGIWSAYSLARHINVVTTDRTVLKLPQDGSKYWTSPVTFTWRAFSSDSIWQVQISDSKTFATTVWDTTVADSTTSHGLDLASTYYWRVRALTKLSKYTTGITWRAYSTTWFFSTITDTPAVVVLQYPNNRETGVDTAVTLSWYRSGRDSLYRLQVSPTTDFDSLTVHDSTLATSYKRVTGLAGSSTYYWRVSSINKVAEGTISDYRRFTTRSTKHK